MFNWLNKKVYADTAAATPVSQRVMNVMKLFEQDIFYNPSSLYPNARIAKDAIENARIDLSLIHI
jgi:cysteine sulfinate desulfinase/cysteine desulfurase-like protein